MTLSELSFLILTDAIEIAPACPQLQFYDNLPGTSVDIDDPRPVFAMYCNTSQSPWLQLLRSMQAIPPLQISLQWSNSALSFTPRSRRSLPACPVGSMLVDQAVWTAKHTSVSNNVAVPYGLIPELWDFSNNGNSGSALLPQGLQYVA